MLKEGFLCWALYVLRIQSVLTYTCGCGLKLRDVREAAGAGMKLRSRPRYKERKKEISVDFGESCRIVGALQAHMVHWCSRHGTSCSHHATATATPPPRASTRSRACSSAHTYIGIILAAVEASWLWSRHIQCGHAVSDWLAWRIWVHESWRKQYCNECIMTHNTDKGNQIYCQHAATPAMLYELLLLPSGPLEGASMCKCSLMRGPTGEACCISVHLLLL